MHAQPRHELPERLNVIPRSPLLTAIPVAIAALILTGCTSTEGLFGGDKVDYRTEAVKTRPLEVPPDLTQLARDSRYQPIGAAGGTVSAGGATPVSLPAAAPATAATASVALDKLENIRIERAGQQRWLVLTQQTPEQLWPKLKAFWEKTGFRLTVDNAQAGVMETNWSENRAKLPNDVVRNLLGSLARNLYDTGERDLFRTRVERLDDGRVEVYIAHRGIEEALSGAQREIATWRVRPTDPGLEAEMLARLMLALGSAPSAAAGAETAVRPAPQALASTVATVTSATQAPARARTTSSGERAAMEVDEPFDRAWRRVGLALDRGGFTVEDRDRTSGIYYVRYSDPKSAGQEEPNFFARVFGGAKDPQTPVRYRIVLKGTGAKTNVDVLTSDGGTGSGENGQRIVARLVDDLK